MHTTPTQLRTDTVGWPTAGLFVDALARRDFAGLGDCLEPDVRFRALVPPGPFELTGADAVVDRFRLWFGGDDAFEVTDASIGQLGSRVYLRWRVRMRATAGARLAEQHVFADTGDRIRSLDLLCSGFHAETTH